jgi:hypothetical protein
MTDLSAAGETIEAFMRAAARADAPSAAQLVSADFGTAEAAETTLHQAFRDRQASFGESEALSVDVGPGSTVSGFRAALTGTVTYSTGRHANVSARLVKANGAWKIARLEFAGFALAPDGS